MTRQRARIASLGVHMFIIGVFGTHLAFAQAQPGPRIGANLPAPAALPSGAAPVVENAVEAKSVELLVGRSTLVEIGTPIARVSLTSADVADALVTAPTQLLVHGKVPGSISMFVWDRAGAVRRFEIAVQRDLARLNNQISELFPGERIQAHSNGKSVVLSGTVSTKEVGEKVVAVASGYVDNKGEVITLLQAQPGPRSNQVLLRVRFAEVSRSAMTQFGMSYFTSPTGVKNNIGRLTTDQFPGGPTYDELAWSKADSSWGAPVTSASGKIEFSDFLNLFLLNQKYDLGVLIKALQTRGLFQSLAEPNLVAESGKEASFLAGGEFPIPIAQGSGANIGVSVQFKEFGIRLNFTPTVSGDRVRLKVRPEVSTLDYGNAVVLAGFRIPSLSTRRAETELEVRNGQTFAIAGLMNNQVSSTLQKVPGIGDIPILGHLFRSRAAQKDRTELVVMITPEILPTDSPGVTTELPRYQEEFMPPVSERQAKPVPPPAFSGTSRSQAMAPATAPVDTRSEIERAQDRALEALDRQNQQRAAVAASPVVAPPVGTAYSSTEMPMPTPPPPAAPEEVLPPAGPTAPAQTTAPAAAQHAEAEARELSKEQMRLEKAAREQADRDAKAAEKVRKEEAKRAAVAQKEAEKLAREQAERDAAAAREQLKRDAAALKEQQKREAEAVGASKTQAKVEDAEEVARRQALAALSEAQREQERQRAIDAAAERLRAAEAEYQAELSRRTN